MDRANRVRGGTDYMGLPQSRPHALQLELGDAWQFGLHGAILRGHDVGPGLRRPGETIGLLCDSGEKHRRSGAGSPLLRYYS